LNYTKPFHFIHMTKDLTGLDAWYDDVFTVKRGWMDHGYMAEEVRDASLISLADTCIEPLAPAFRIDGWDSMPLGRFFNRFGSRWESIAVYCDDVTEVWQACTDNKIRVFLNGGIVATERPDADCRAVFTHPRDTIGKMQFTASYLMSGDARFKPGYDPNWWREHHPTGLERLAYATAITSDLERAKHIYVDVFGGELLHVTDSTLTGTSSAYVALGETVIELAMPTIKGTYASDDLERNGEMHHALTFKVSDLEKANKYLATKGVKSVARDDQTVLYDPETTMGAFFRLTTWSVPNDPRD
jgi:hypothetical protein